MYFGCVHSKENECKLYVPIEQNHQPLAFSFSKRILLRSPGFALPLDAFITCKSRLMFHKSGFSIVINRVSTRLRLHLASKKALQLGFAPAVLLKLLRILRQHFFHHFFYLGRICNLQLQNSQKR